MLHIVVFLVQLLLGLGKKPIGSDTLLNLDLARWQFLGALTIVLEHAGLASLSLGLLLSLLLLSDALLLSGVLFADDNGRCLHASNVSRSYNGSLTDGRVALALGVDVAAQLAQVVIVDNGNVRVDGGRRSR